MGAPTSLACWTALQEQGAQLYWIYVAAGGTAVDLACFTSTTEDEQLWLIYQALLGGGGGSSPIDVDAPSSLTDFSTLPGGVLPTSGTYQALDDNFIYTLLGGTDTTWQQTPREN